MKNNNGNVKLVRNSGIILAILLYTAIRFIIIGKSQMIGAAYFFSAFDFVLLFIIGGGFCILDVISKHSKAQMDLDFFRNAKRVLRYGSIIGFLYAGLISVVILLLQDTICDKLLAGANSKMALLWLLPMLIFVCISAAFKGFFMGAKRHKEAYLALALEMLISLICVIVCISIMSKTGSKAAALMNDYKILYAYQAGGAAIGLSIGSGIGLIIDFVMYVLLSKQLLLIDETKRMVDVYDLTIQLVSEMLFLGVSMFIPLFAVFVSQAIYVAGTAELPRSTSLYGLGAFYGVFGTVVTGFVLFSYCYAFFDKKVLSIAFTDYNRQELRSKVNNMIKLFFIYALPFATMIIAMADVIVAGFTGEESALAANLIRAGMIAAIFYAFGIMFMNILIAINKTFTAIINGIVALILEAVFLFFLLNKFQMGTTGLVFGFYAFSIVFALLTYISACNGLKNKPKLIKNMIGPVIIAAVTGVLALVLRLIFGLFIKIALVNVILTSIICLIVMFIAYIKMGVTDYHHVSKSPISFILVPFGQIIGLFRRK